jgi:hypothetical protein
MLALKGEILNRVILMAVFAASLPAAAGAAELKTIEECVAGKAVTTKNGDAATIVGINKIVPTLKCNVKVTRTGETQSVIYWDLNDGAVVRSPAQVAVAKYSCVTFAGIVGLNNAGRVEVRPLFDVRVTGPGTYIGSDNKPGTFTYDAAQGMVNFTSGANKGQSPKYTAQGGGQFVYKGETGEIDCGIDRH